MKYILQDLLTVRGHRVDSATKLVARRRQELSDCRQRLTDRERDLRSYIDDRLKKETQLYSEILGKKIVLQDLENVKAEVNRLRVEEAAYQQRVLDARCAVDQALIEVDNALASQRQAIRAEEKLKEHRDLWSRETLRLQTLKEDLELEDIPFKPRFKIA